MHKDNQPEGGRLVPISSRRRFVQGLAIGGAIMALNGSRRHAFGQAAPHSSEILTGQDFELTIDSLPVNFTGRRTVATAINGSVPGPTLRWREGDTVTIAVTNRLKTPTSIHWHGMRLPAGMDGVPGLSYPGIAPGETFHYRIPVKQSGTYWYHSHSRFQEQTGLSGALIVERSSKDPIEFDREYVIFLSDWTDANPETVYSNLKEQSDYYNYHRLTVPSFVSEAKKKGLAATASDRLTWAHMNMSPTDLSDVSGATYTYLLNGNTPNANWTGLFQPGERVRLRIINGSSMTFFDVRIPGLQMTVVQSDGNDVEPVTVDEFRIGVAEVYDVIVQPKEDAAYTIFAQSEDRSGYARGTLTPKIGMAAIVPPMDPRPMRTMVDMGMGNMAGMKKGGMSGMDMSGVDGMKKSDMSASSKDAADKDKSSMPGMNMGDQDMAGMDMSSNAEKPATPSAHDDMQAMGSMEMGNSSGTTPFPQPGPTTMPIMAMSDDANAEVDLRPSDHVQMHVGPQVDNVPMQVSERLNDPGIGLSGNGRRVLTYADLRARYRGVDGRPPTREIELHLSGSMERYIWGFNGQKFSSAQPIELKLGERVRFVLINDTMMEHPIHLHGLWSELENGHGEFNPYKHTIIVKPAERLSYLVSADTPGRWAYHCHLLYHMEAGMFRTVVVS
ncbi:MAG: copper resistance system multicopper oxidase [Acidobacteria bacterium]|nr:copper resistance system multicopper oxidase [Acidobacteriota bacterium]